MIKKKMVQMEQRDYDHVHAMVECVVLFQPPSSARPRTLASLVTSNLRLVLLKERELEWNAIY